MKRHLNYHERIEEIERMTKNERGIGLIYVIILIAILLIAVGALGPYLFVRETYRQKDVETLERIKAIRTAILGNPEIISKGLRSNFGYVGDMGGLPPLLEYLVLQQSPTPNPFPFNWNQTGWTIDATTGIGYGWRGPYIDPTYTGNYEFQAFRDAWGTKFRYIDNAGNTIIHPASVSFPVFIRSAGPDRIFGTSDDINESNRPELCRINEDDVRAILRGYTYCEDGTSIQRDNIYVYWPTLALGGGVTITTGGPYSSSSTGVCPYQQTQTCYYFETPRMPIGIRKATIENYVNQFVVINGGGTLHDNSTNRMRWNFRGGSCGGCIVAVLPRRDYRQRAGPCTGGSRDVFIVGIRNRCATSVTINSIMVEYYSSPTIYYRNAFIIDSQYGGIGPGWSYACGGAPAPGGRSGVTYSFNSTGMVIVWGVPIDVYSISCSPTNATIPSGATRYLVVGNFITFSGGCGEINNITFRITLSDGSIFTVPPPL